MPQWEGSNRRERLPDDWDVIRVRILARDRGRCRWIGANGQRCSAAATDVDHIRPGDDHSDRNLQSLCGPHHQLKSSREGAWALHRKRKEIAKRFRRDDKHPGVID